MAITRERIELILTNPDELPKVWNLAGSNLQKPIVTRKEANVSAYDKYSPKPVFIGNVAENILLADQVYISNVSEARDKVSADESIVQSIQTANQFFRAAPIKVNKIKIFTNNVDQLYQTYAYYKQSAAGLFERRLLDVISHYDSYTIRPIVEIGKKYLGGELILDGNRRLEVTVLPKTSLIIELLFETEDPMDNLPGASSGGDQEHEERESGNDQKDGKESKESDHTADDRELKEADRKSIRLFVKTFYKEARQSEKLTGVPALFALSQSTLDTGYDIVKPGNNMFAKVAGRRWDGNTVAIEGLQEPNASKDAPKSKQFLKAFDNPLRSFMDNFKVFQEAKYQDALESAGDPYAFAEKIVSSGYSESEEYGDNIEKAMAILEPYLQELDQAEKQAKAGKQRKEAVLWVAGGVLFCVLFYTLLVKYFFAKGV